MRHRNRVLPLTALCLAAALAAAGCDSSLPSLDSPGSDWDQREQDRNDADNIIDEIVGGKSFASGDYGATGLSASPPAGLGRGAEPATWSDVAQAWISSGTTTWRGVDWEWTFLLRNVAAGGVLQQTPDGDTERVEVVLTADGARTSVKEGVTTQQVMSWTVLGVIIGMGSGDLDISVTGLLDSQSVRLGEVTDLPGEFSATVSVPEDTDGCPTGEYTMRIADFTVTGVFDPDAGQVNWIAYAGDIEEGEEPIATGSSPVQCEEAP